VGSSLGIAAVAFLVVVSAASAAPPQAATSVWTGVYTNEQASRGRASYEIYCASCHGPTLGGEDGPPLVGTGFLRNWLEDDLYSLFRRVHDRMPADAPGSLPENVSADLVAYLLQANEFPSGARELTPNKASLSAVRIQGKNGPAPVPNFSLVRVVGCLAQDAKSQWIVKRGTEPVRARDDSSSAEPNALKNAPLGSHTFRLMDASAAQPEQHAGEKVEVTGLLMRQAESTVLNVTSLKTAGSACPE
jgi:quinoprotein glucose dehydrogenase